jgi:hypothetical protein
VQKCRIRSTRKTSTQASVRSGIPDRFLALAFAAALVSAGAGPTLAQDDDCVGFLEQVISPGGTNGVQSIYAIDLDGDDDVDVVSASSVDDKIAWYENLGDGGLRAPTPTFDEHTITTRADGASAVYAADVDGDGDVDILSASTNDDTIAWYENSGTSPMVFYERTISSNANVALSVFAVDLDGDGDTDVLSASFLDNTIAWYENEPSGENPFSPVFTKRTISTSALGASSVHAADLDQDGDMDVLAASLTDNKIMWYEVKPGSGTSGISFERHVISSSVDGPRAVYAADVDDDGDMDVLSASLNDGKIVWYENENDRNPRFIAWVVADDLAGAKSVFVTDVDGDGNSDILAAGEAANQIVWYKSDEASPPGFEAQSIASDVESVDAVVAADLDGDLAQDILFASSVPGLPAQSDEIGWYANDGSSPPDFPKNTISSAAVGANFILPLDFDGDGDTDLLSAGDRRIAWHENTGAALPDGPELIEHVISTGPAEATGVFAIDLDTDGDLDVIAAASEEDRLAWYENDGTNSFVENLVSSEIDAGNAIFAADIDQDGDVDILSASTEDDKVTLYENDGASPPGFVGRVDSAGGPRSVFIADLNGDDHLDFLVASADDNEIAWYENDGAMVSPTFQVHRITANADGATSVSAADLDGDGDLDVLSASARDDKIAWYRNDPAGEDSTDRVFTTTLISAGADVATSVFAADIDGDDDIDVVSGSFADNELAWYENDGEVPPGFTRHPVSNGLRGTLSVAAADIDGDDRMDLVAAYLYEIAWYEQHGETCGMFDATGDDQIDGGELSWLMKAFGLPATDPDTEWWWSLDFNQDQIVDGLDLAILASLGVWGKTPSTCSYACR